MFGKASLNVYTACADFCTGSMDLFDDVINDDFETSKVVDELDCSASASTSAVVTSANVDQSVM